MAKSNAAIFGVIALVGVASTSLHAAPKTACEWEGKGYANGESVFVADPLLISATIDELEKKGYDKQAAAAIAKSSDWSGYLLRCVHEMSVDPQTERLKRGRGVWVLSEVHEDYFKQVHQSQQSANDEAVSNGDAK